MNSLPLVAFRVDATPKVALGHLRRCMAIAEAVRRKGGDVVFLCYDDAGARAALSERNFICKWLVHEVAEGDDLSDTLALASGLHAAVLVVDSYSVDAAYIEALREKIPLVAYFDDFGWTDCRADLVINGLPSAPGLGYVAAKCLLGPEYLVLSPEYWTPSRRDVRSRVSNVLVTMGGIDHYDLSSRSIRFLGRIAMDISVHIVVGPYYENLADIERAAAPYDQQIVLHKAPSSLYELIAEADIAISAGGFTLYELASMGVPSVGIALWDNQKPNVEALGARQIIVPLVYAEESGFDHRLENAVTSLMEDEELRRSACRAGRVLVDGQGALRVAGAILNSNYQRGTV